MRKLTLLSFAVILVFVSVAETYGIPAFARKYNMSCKTCHSPIPYLKPYGDEFAGNGFQLSDQEAPRYYVETGDPELNLIRDLPLAFRMDGYLTYNEINSDESNFTAPLLFKILSGGTITNDVAYYIYYILEHGERGKIEDALLMFNNLFGSELDFTIGQFQICDPLFKRELRLMKDDYYIYKVRPGLSKIDLTYDRGVMFSYGFETGTDIIFEVINGSGIGETFDTDKYKNFFGRISQDIGEHFRIGAMGLLGKELYNGDWESLRNDMANEITMFGGDASIAVDPFELNLQYVERKDDNPWFINQALINSLPLDLERTTRGAFAELIYRPMGDDSKWYAAGLFNWIESEENYLNYKTLSGHFGYLLKRNIRLVTELRYDFNQEFVQAGLGFITAF